MKTAPTIYERTICGLSFFSDQTGCPLAGGRRSYRCFSNPKRIRRLKP
ncbi:hypothetical protein D1AOALGA4SA_959 [Olavius algarvensis Delta 1 endosymbiont]|nr:hypothetical protein D1AOALGA4SA_959 [Olavius algarvensis Delta 1 endosymbiont]